MDNPDTLFSSLHRRPTVSVKELAEKLGEHPETVRRKLVKKEIPGGFRTGAGAHWRIRKKIVEAWYKELMERLGNG